MIGKYNGHLLIGLHIEKNISLKTESCKGVNEMTSTDKTIQEKEVQTLSILDEQLESIMEIYSLR